MESQEQSFTRASEQAVNKELRSGLWLVYEDYTCDYAYDRFDAVGDRYLYAPPHSRGKDGVPVENKVVDEYAPLHEPALFLEFAGLAEEMDTPGLSLRPERLEGVLALPKGLDTGRNAAVALDWVQRYGVLGLTAHTRAGTWWPDTRGGEGDTLKRFVYEAWVANTALKLYDAAKAAPGPDVDAIEEILLRFSRSAKFRNSRQARSSALAAVDEQLQSRWERHCFPQIYRRADGTAMLGYGFLSLLGAMWIQMGWLLTASADEVRRCLWCNKPIAFKGSVPPENAGLKKNVRGKYPTRKDRKFCDNNGRCKGLYHYHYRVKPRR